MWQSSVRAAVARSVSALGHGLWPAHSGTGPPKAALSAHVSAIVERMLHQHSSHLVVVRLFLPNQRDLGGRSPLAPAAHALAGLADGAGLLPMDPAEVPDQSEWR